MWRYKWWGKNTTDDYKSINIKKFKEWGYLQEWTRKSWSIYWHINWNKNWEIWIEVNTIDINNYIRVKFSQTDRFSWLKENFDYKIRITKIKCNYWWYRYFFICPCSWIKCSILYLQNNWYFACRKILNLCYESQNYSKYWRLLDSILWKEYEAEKLYNTIKYKYRNGKITRKFKKYQRLARTNVSLEEKLNCYKIR